MNRLESEKLYSDLFLLQIPGMYFNPFTIAILIFAPIPLILKLSRTINFVLFFALLIFLKFNGIINVKSAESGTSTGSGDRSLGDINHPETNLSPFQI
ncbi:MAG: hypothetical protein KAS39_00870, partial [Actinomycetia bacterium]|nr:hypothetical protein [Actinomycetes bacterium]